jgi:hypothetical protein
MRSSYNKQDDGGARDAWVSSMLLNDDWKIANDAMFKANPQAIAPQTTLNNLLIAAKAKIGLFSSNYDAVQRPTQSLSPSTLTDTKSKIFPH